MDVCEKNNINSGIFSEDFECYSTKKDINIIDYMSESTNNRFKCVIKSDSDCSTLAVLKFHLYNLLFYSIKIKNKFKASRQRE